MDSATVVVLSEWVIVDLLQMSNLSATLRREHVTFQWDDDDVRFVLDQHAPLDFYIASWLNQQSRGRHVGLLGSIILIPSQRFFDLTPNAASLAEKQRIPVL